MKTLNIKEKLTEINVNPETLILGDWDYIGEYTAKRHRSPGDENYKYGCFYRSNYERMILAYHLVKEFKLTSFLEIGFGRGAVSVAVGKAFYDLGIQGKIITVDPNFDEKFLKFIGSIFPKEWLSCVTFVNGLSQDVLPKLNENFDFVYIDGDHSYSATKNDWNNVKDKFTKFCLFDDYHLPSKNDPGIRCREAIDEIVENQYDCDEKQLILMDRVIFKSDKFNDQLPDYGQVLLTKKGIANNSDW